MQAVESVLSGPGRNLGIAQIHHTLVETRNLAVKRFTFYPMFNNTYSKNMCRPLLLLYIESNVNLYLNMIGLIYLYLLIHLFTLFINGGPVSST